MIDLTGKVTLITGGSRGIGAACVKLFSAANSKVAFTYKQDKEAAEKLISTIKAGADLKAYRVDLEFESEINTNVEHVIKDFDRLDILVNNAGIWNDGPIDMELAHWEETIRINLTSSFLYCKAAARYMKKNKFGRIINISSTAGQRGEAFHSHYAASKGGIISFTKSLAVELAEYNITVNSIAPGWVDTDMCTGVFSDKEFKENIRRSIPVGRIAAVEDIAGPTLFLASDLARHINGEILNVNGGSILCG
ncbi:MAG: alcohol dehydrogenase [Ignavibacteria bacterium RBG_13_36_8]|nr:MAG: alcohol dehydrogenase [Ignavibacteria bacterium RBG_13_36_8]